MNSEKCAGAVGRSSDAAADEATPNNNESSGRIILVITGLDPVISRGTVLVKITGSSPVMTIGGQTGVKR